MYIRSYKDENIKYNTRLVTRGFEEENLYEICNLFVGRKFFLLIIGIIINNKWKIHSLYIKSAFLHGNQIYREMYLKSSSEAGARKLCRLNISVYGNCVPPRSVYGHCVAPRAKCFEISP